MKNAVLHKVCTDHLKYLSTITFLDIPEYRMVQYYIDGKKWGGIVKQEFTKEQRKRMARNVIHLAKMFTDKDEKSYVGKPKTYEDDEPADPKDQQVSEA